MATASEVKAGLDEVAERIRAARASVKTAINGGSTASTELASIQADYSDLIATINGYGTADEFEALSKAELAKLTAEFTALKAVADSIAAETV